MFQKIFAAVLLAIGIVYGIVAVCLTLHDREKLQTEPGRLPVIAANEIGVYLCASFGISDYLLNTLVLKYSKANDELLPGTLVSCCVTPGVILAFSLLWSNQNPIDTTTLVVCCVGIILGSIVGTRLAGKFDGSHIKNIMRVSLICSFLVLLLRTILSPIEAGAAALTGGKLILAGTLCFITSTINMFGISMKPTWTAIFLLLGLSSLTTLTLLLVVCALGPVTGGPQALHIGRYHRKTVLCGTIFGSIGALLGTLLAISIPALLLNIILLAVMLLAIITMFR